MEKSVTEGIFPGMAGLFSPVGTEQVQRLQAAGQPVDPLQAVSGSMGFLGERMRQGIGSAFGQMPQQDRKRQVFQQLVQQLSQQGVDISTSDGMVQLAQKLSSMPGFEGEALNLRQKAAQMAQQAQAAGLETQFKRSQIAKNIADAQKSAREGGAIKPTATFSQVARGLGLPAYPDINQYTPDQVIKINDAIKQQDLDKARASAANVVAKVNMDTPESQMKAISEVNTNLKPYAEPLVNAIQGIQLGMMRESPFAQKGFETTVGNIFGNQVRAQAEIERLRNSGNLGERLTNTLSLFLSGKIGEATKEDQMEVLLALYAHNNNQYDTFAEPYRSAIKDPQKANQLAPLSPTRFPLPALPPGKQYIPMSAVVANELKKNEQFKYKGEIYKYNGDGTISKVKGK